MKKHKFEEATKTTGGMPLCYCGENEFARRHKFAKKAILCPKCKGEGVINESINLWPS